MWFQNTDFSQVRALVVGDIMLDQYWDGMVTRVSPEAPVPVVNVNEVTNRLGGAGNVANNIAALGAKVTLIAYTGKDETAAIISQALTANNIQQQIIPLDGYPTIKKLRILSHHQQLIRLDTEQRFTDVDPHDLITAFKAAISHCDVVILSDYAKGTINDPQVLINIAKEHNIPVVIDPKRADFKAYQGATVITPNLKELQDVVGVCTNERVIVEKSRSLLQEYDLAALLITRGGDGMTVVPADAPEIHLSACSGEVYDVTGAGDTVVAAVAVALAKQVKLIDAARFANLAASIAVGKLGTATVSLAELQKAAFQTTAILPTGVMTEEQLIPVIRAAQAKGERVVFVNGCYDILHYGHIRYLEQARAFGDRLIVGVNSDTSVARLKGPTRPINPETQRMGVLAGLKTVDWVVPFSENTPGRLVAALDPDILVKSDEYYSSITEIPATEGAAHVLARGGKIYLARRTPDISTTAIMQAINEQQ